MEPTTDELAREDEVEVALANECVRVDALRSSLIATYCAASAAVFTWRLMSQEEREHWLKFAEVEWPRIDRVLPTALELGNRPDIYGVEESAE